MASLILLRMSHRFTGELVANLNHSDLLHKPEYGFPGRRGTDTLPTSDPKYNWVALPGSYGGVALCVGTRSGHTGAG
jgi:hypothetical protein